MNAQLERNGWYGSGAYAWTVLCKMPGDGRGEFSEEIDVRTKRRSITAAKRVAQQAITESYEPALRPVKVIQRVDGTVF